MIGSIVPDTKIVNPFKPSVFIWDIGKQWKNTSDAAGFALFAYKCTFEFWMKLKFTTQQLLNSKWIRPNDKDEKFQSA